MTQMILPWPAKELSPNARVHHMAKAKVAKKARADAFHVAKISGWQEIKLPEGRLHLWITFRPPTKRMPDDDNMLARFKPYRDGLADALKVDDKRFISHPYVSDKPIKGGCVIVRITGGPTP